MADNKLSQSAEVTRSSSTIPGAAPAYSATAAAAVKSEPVNGGWDKSERIFKSTEWRDLWAAVLYYLSLVGVFLVIGFNLEGLKGFSSTTPGVEPEVVEAMWRAAGIMCATVVAGIVLFCGFMMLATRFPMTIIKSSMIGFTVFYFVMGLSVFFVPAAIGTDVATLPITGLINGFVCILMGVINLICYLVWRRRIPFTSVLLKNTVEVLKIYPATWNLAVLAVLGQVLLGALHLFATALVVFKHIDASGHADMRPEDQACIVFLLFSGFWSTQVIDNVVHTAVCGVFASYYFLHGTGAAMVKPVWRSLQRALTYSFGSIAFGSLIVALIQLVRSLARNGRGRNNLAAALLSCLLMIVEDLVRYFNHYAYVHVAIYGKPFVASSMDTWEMIKSHGVDVVINDQLVGTVMAMTIIFIAVVSHFMCYFFSSLSLPDEGWAFTVSIVSMIMVWCIVAVASQVISSGVSATLVCFAEDPAALKRTKPELHHKITTAYSRIGV